MNINQLSMKIFCKPPLVDQGVYIPIFHRWIRETSHLFRGKVLIDVADYRHVEDGPGIMLIGHEAYWGMDTLGGTGLRYYRKRDAVGPLPEKLNEAFSDLMAVAERLQAESPTVFDPQRLQVDFFSRQFAEQAQFAEAQKEVAAWAGSKFSGGVEVNLPSGSVSDVRAPLALVMQAKAAQDMAALRQAAGI